MSIIWDFLTSVLKAGVCPLSIRPVRVIKLVAQDSIEDAILNIGKKKLQLEQKMTATQDGKTPPTH